MQNDFINDFSQHFLIAMPSLTHPLFKESVIYVYEHDDQGAMAFIINKPLKITMGDILRQFTFSIKNEKVNTISLLNGGPVSREQLYILQRGKAEVSSPLTLAQPKPLLEKLAKGENGTHIICFLGYAGWQAGQLEEEVKSNDWLICPANEDILFNTPYNLRWQTAVNKMGIDVNQLSRDTGHA